MKDVFVEVCISVSHTELDRLYTYKVPDNLIDKVELGMRVIVPFSLANKNVEAYVINITDSVDFDIKRIKYVLSLPDEKPIFDRQMLNLAYFMKEKYYCNLYDCLNLMKPRGIKFANELAVVYIKEEGKLTENQQQVLDALKGNSGKMCKSELVENLGDSVGRTIKSLENKGFVEVKQVTEVKDLTQRVRYVYLNYDYENFDDEFDEVLRQQNQQSKVLDFLQENDRVPFLEVKKILKISDSPFKTLEKKELIKIEQVEILRSPSIISRFETKKIENYTNEQEKAINTILDIKEGRKDYKPVLLHGVTGSGKTEIYLRIVEEVLKEGKQAIVLVPEIALTGQTVNTFINRFKEAVTVTHSRLTAGERYDQWKKARDNQVSIMIGPRSALFMPFDNLGAIIIDEEHESTYKSEVTPKYDSTEVAIERGKYNNALVILGSATPKVESYYKAEQGEYELIKLSRRVNNMTPNIELVDLRQELAEGNKSIFSRLLIDKINKSIERDEQIILFINRRGFSNFVSCRTCGEVIKCSNCDVSMTYHHSNDKLTCHYCNKRIQNPKNCPTCGSKHIKFFGIGTQKIESELQKLYPHEKIVRMDADTTKGKNGHETLIKEFRSGNARFLVGTQMIAKGLDFPNVTCVGVIASDLSLFSNDFRASENTFQVLKQVIGRAGRAEKQGDTILQTYSPENFTLQLIKDGTYEDFYKQEIIQREISDNFPFCNLFQIMLSSTEERKVIQLLHKLYDIMYIEDEEKSFQLVGPAPCNVSKIKKLYRFRLIVKGKNEKELVAFSQKCIQKLKKSEDTKEVFFNISLNPNVFL